MIAETEVDWGVDFAAAVPCLWPDCGHEVAWFGNQHGCKSGHCCNYHLREYLSEIMDELSDRGHLVCAKCQTVFYALPNYFKAVRA